jgi:flavodoxin
MSIQIRYFSRSGNTEKLAREIGKELRVEAKTIDQSVPSGTKLLFLGASVYWGGVDNSIKKFIKTARGNVSKIAVFGTAAVAKSPYKELKSLLEQSGFEVEEREFHCRGAFGPIHKGRPNADDLKAIRVFAREVAAVDRN